jgi:hypothetical protein
MDLTEWNTGEPPMSKVVTVLCDDCMGEYTMQAEAIPYKKKPTWMKKSTWGHRRNKWRWMKRNERGGLVRLSRKETPSGWKFT